MTLKDELEKLAKATKLLGETPEQRAKDKEAETASEQYPRINQRG